MILPLSFPELEDPLRVLVVDDQMFDREMIVSRLREVVPDNCIIYEANSGKETLQNVADAVKGVNCVLLDMNLGDMHGAEVTRKILDMRPDMSIIIITAEADMAKALDCLHAGAEDFLIKGEYSNFGLYRTIRYAMERRLTAMEKFKLSQALNHERSLTAAQKEFIHFVSHEFRTPMAIISGAVQMLRAKIPDVAQGLGAKQFNKIDTAISRLTLLLDDVIRLDRLEEGKELVVKEQFDLAALTLTVANSFENQRVECENMPDSLIFHGDSRLIDYALHNLISNALKYSPEGEKVLVSIDQGDGKTTISVRDKGAGMSKETLARLGEKFFRDGKTSHIEGTGLGIYLSRRFMEYHGGTVVYESTPGEGTTARLVF